MAVRSSICGVGSRPVDPVLIALGTDPHRTQIDINGFVAPVNNAWLDVWENGGAYAFPAAGGVRMEAISTSANDDVGNTGITQLSVHYLDANYTQQVEYLNMDGLVASPTTAVDILRINNVHAEGCGTAGAAVGNISLRLFGGGATYAYIAAGGTLAQQCIYTVPDGYMMMMYNWGFSSGAAVAGHDTSFRWVTTWDDEHSTNHTFFNTLVRMHITDNAYQMRVELPIRFGPRADIKIQAISDNAAAAVTAASWAQGWLEPV